MATRLATPTAKEMDIDEPDGQVRDAKQPWPEQGWSQPQKPKEDKQSRERKLNWTRPSMMPGALLLVVSLM